MNRFRSLMLMLPTALLAGCGSLPTRPEENSPGHVDTDATLLGRALGPLKAEHPGVSGVYPLKDGIDAFAARMALAAAAERMLDAQYYIWHSDDSGKLLANQLVAAADRGVRVRLLLDDYGDIPSDEQLIALDNHPNIEVRLFNPFVNRTFRLLNALLEFNRINRRMHNKSFTVDNQATIIGGRNVGDEYFSAALDFEFADLDVVGIGPIVDETADSFDLFWRSPSSVPIGQLHRQPVSAARAQQYHAMLADHSRSLENSTYLRAARAGGLVKGIREHALEFYWGRAWLAHDLPQKVVTAPSDQSTHLMPHLRPVIDATVRELLIVSPYFIPGRKGVEFLRSLRRRGVRVVVVTNSLAATDVAAVHAGYRRYRKALLRAGVELYEFKPTAVARGASSRRQGGSSSGSGSGSSSRASLHAKTFVFDRQKVFVGSLNIDPRSTALNTEIGAVIEVPALAEREAREIERSVRESCYRLEFVPGTGPCTECGSINWVTEENGVVRRYKREPEAGFGRRFLVGLLALLPIEGQL